jgi:septum formation protein
MPATRITVSRPVLYLASQSPRRRQLLDQIGIRHELLLPGSDEDAEALEALIDGEVPEVYCQRVTLAKLEAARTRLLKRGLPDGAILAADTTVAIDQRIFGKPDDDEHAAHMLQQLAGRSHRVITVVAVLEGAHPVFTPQLALQVSVVRMRALQADEIVRYVASGESQGKAGSYAIQSQAAAWIEHIEGSYSGIMGLPLFETAQLLRRIGLP